MAERHTHAPTCCGQHMEIIIKQAPYGYVERPINYICPVTNEGVTSKAQRREIMAREGLVSAHETMNTKAQRDAKEQRVKELSEQSYGPKEVMKQANEWGKKQVLH